MPLAGKSLDMLWLAEHRHPVLRVEPSPLTVEQFFTQNGLTSTVLATAEHQLRRSGA